MALHLKTSNSLESLAQGLSANLHKAKKSVFDPYYIVTQTEGMNNWLKLEMAQRQGIAANFRFLKPNDLIFQIYIMLGGPFRQILSVQNLAWIIFCLLGEDDFTGAFPDIAIYYTNLGPDKDIRRMALAEKLADLFDQYQVYRPEMIKVWNKCGLLADGPEGWQQWLWAKAKILSNETLPDKTLVGKYILEALKDSSVSQSLATRLPFVHLFGLSIITNFHISILFELSSLIDVYFHILNPAPQVYWFDDKSEKQLAAWRSKGLTVPEEIAPGNPLLTGWGRIIQESFQQFFRLDDFLNAYEEIGILRPENDTLLHKIQQDIFNATVTDRNSLAKADITDGSITINACFTIAREVEVLYNHLVYLVDKKSLDLSSRDIVVMVTDIDSYAPFIKAVFGNAPFRFRYTIADESYAGNDNLFDALHALMAMDEENFKAEEVLQLLDFSCIRNRFEMKDTLQIRRIVQEANIRFGFDGEQEYGTNLVSWRYGIKRIMYGICMSGGAPFGEGNEMFFPLDLLEGDIAPELIRFCHFLTALIDSIESRRNMRTIAEWVFYAEQLLHGLAFEPAEETDEDYTVMIMQLAGYNVLNEYVKDKISYEVFSHSFLQTLGTNSRSRLFVNGGITFCSLIPMRSIPFKVVALMGMNYDKFPRREQKSGFNLMERNRQPGDRNIRENDKHLFLETLLSARQFLYISYIGKSANDNTVLPPSAIIDELIDYIEAGTDDADEVKSDLITLQPLHGFSRKYSGNNQRYYSYLNASAVNAVTVTDQEKKNEPFNFEQIQLDDLVNFYKNPFKFYYNKVLGIYYSDEESLLSDTELFSLDHLQQWVLKNMLLPVEEKEIAALQEMLLRKGALPLANMAFVAMQGIEEVVSPVRNLYKDCVAGLSEKVVSFELNIGSSLFTGNLPGLFGNNLIQSSWSKNETKYLIEAYIHFLAGCASENISGLSFISFTSKKSVFHARALSKSDAQARLGKLIDIYKEGFINIAPFYPDFKVLPGAVFGIDRALFLRAVEDKLNNYKFPCSDPYIMREYENGYFTDEGILDTYKHICIHTIVPLLEIFPDYFD